MPRSVRVGVKLIGLAIMVCGLIGPYTVLLCIAPKRRHVVARWFFKGCLSLTSVRLDVHGRLDPKSSMLVANHASYLDIPILGSLSSQSVFVAKKDVSSWPVFGLLARIAQTIFISRNPNDVLKQTRKLAESMSGGRSIIVFPEGTSTDGSHVRPFKSSLFSVFDQVEAEAWVQPVTIAYDRLHDGAPMSQSQREGYAWFGDMTLFPHLVGVFSQKGCRVSVQLHKPVLVRDFNHRKELAAHCQRTISEELMRRIQHQAVAYEPREKARISVSH